VLENEENPVKLEEYTLTITHREDWGSYEASLLEFYGLIASGQSELEARAELARMYAERVAYLTALGKPLPVPGEAPEELFSSTARVDAEAALARDFFTRVLLMDYDEVYLNDATQLEEFGDFDTLRLKALAVYDVDIGAELERPLWEIFKVIRASSR
jgi:hypothetical protein